MPLASEAMAWSSSIERCHCSTNATSSLRLISRIARALFSDVPVSMPGPAARLPLPPDSCRATHRCGAVLRIAYSCDRMNTDCAGQCTRVKFRVSRRVPTAARLTPARRPNAEVLRNAEAKGGRCKSTAESRSRPSSEDPVADHHCHDAGHPSGRLVKTERIFSTFPKTSSFGQE